MHTVDMHQMGVRQMQLASNEYSTRNPEKQSVRRT